MFLENQLSVLGTLIEDRMAEGFGDISTSAAALLITLLNRGPLTVSGLAGIVGVTQPTATRLIEGLEKRKFLRRAAREGRLVTVSLTASGRRKAGTLQSRRAALAADLTGPLSAKERKRLGRLIDKVLYDATASRTDARTTCRYCDHGLCSAAGDCPVDRRATALEQAAPAASR